MTTTTAARPPAPAPATAGRNAITERARAERRLGTLLVTPAVIAMIGVAGYPIAYAGWLSLHRADLRFPNQTTFIGLRNYGDVLTSSVWWSAVATTLTITVLSVVVELVIGMAVAMVLHRAIFFRRTVRTAVLIPYGIITVVASLAWKYAFTPNLGFVNSWFHVQSDLLGSRVPSLLIITMTEVWKTTPFMALLLLAGLALVPDELLKAATVDGANAIQRFFKITLPLMKPAIAVALLFRSLDAFRIFDSVFILTRGANGTETVSITGYNQLINRLNLGIGSAVSVLIFVCVLLIALLYVKGFGASLVQQGARR
ncbi:MAG TPA: sugar ABC transporter permease [Acidimicrobiales bacterium]|nr:sugar ABC transporter permease [Acidimicrobiales bacterium]